MTRYERDSLGEKGLPDEAYFGIQTLRAMENFPVSGTMEKPSFIKAYVMVKRAAALANMELDELEEPRGKAIIQAADEVLEGNFMDQLKVDVFQAGAGTSFNMNINEVLANRALELLGRPKGDYGYLSPNDHVNRAQSTNDTFPTASHLAIIHDADSLIMILQDLASAFNQKGDQFSGLPKSGRTHLMDALPLTLGDEFSAYGSAISRAAERIQQRRVDLLEIPIGGTAVGTGANAHPQYGDKVIHHLSRWTSLDLKPVRDSFEGLQSRSQMGSFSSSLRELSLELIRIANDLRLLGSGPTTGFAEIRLPAVQSGSSIMAGKVNPVMAECLNMVAYQVLGNDTTVSMAVQAGQIDLNVMTPVMTYNILQSISLLSNYLPIFQKKCVEGIEANEEHLSSYIELNPMFATLLAPRIGYLKAAEIAKEAHEKSIPVKELAVKKKVITKEEAEELFDVERIARSLYRK
ncbi:MAG: aspartate ammonia-lyase [Archaeoglobaceae archaeon]